MRSDIPATIADLLPFPLFSRAADMTSSQDIVNTLESAGQFTTLVSALKVAGLSDTLKAAGPLTVFAPTDTAFQKLSAGILDTLLKPENHTKLAAILTYHMVAGNIKAAVVMTTSCAITLNRQAITLSLKGNQVKINDGTVIKADVAASNGTIHVIDTVLLPK